jgi:hypothetical protein
LNFSEQFTTEMTHIQAVLPGRIPNNAWKGRATVSSALATRRRGDASRYSFADELEESHKLRR